MGEVNRPGPVIETLTESDLPALARLHRQFWGEDSSPEKMRAAFRRLHDDHDYLLLVARYEGQVVGSVMGIICEELYGDCRPFLLIEDFVVDESRRRLGIGSALMRELERLAAVRGCGSILFLTEAERQGAVRFYRSLGYEHSPYRGFKKRL